MGLGVSAGLSVPVIAWGYSELSGIEAITDRLAKHWNLYYGEMCLSLSLGQLALFLSLLLCRGSQDRWSRADSVQNYFAYTNLQTMISSATRLQLMEGLIPAGKFL